MTIIKNIFFKAHYIGMLITLIMDTISKHYMDISI